MKSVVITLEENFHVTQLPPASGDYCNKPKNKKDDLTLDQFMQHLRIKKEPEFTTRIMSISITK